MKAPELKVPELKVPELKVNGVTADMIGVELRTATPDAWVSCVMENFDEFLIDHAANERKASSLAMSLVAHYPDKQALVTSMVDLALEELNHFRMVLRLMQARNIALEVDEKDLYVNLLRKQVRTGPGSYFMDRLLCAAMIEARGEERFHLLAKHLVEPELQVFYEKLARSEANHHQVFVRLALHYFDEDEVAARLLDWQEMEAKIMAEVPIRARMH